MTERPRHASAQQCAQEQASDWFSQRQALEHDPCLRQRFEQWRNVDPEHANAYQAMENLWNDRAFEQALQDLASDLELPPAVVARPRRRATQRYLAVAAALLLMLGGGWMTDLPLRLQADHLTATGKIEPLDLADGSHIVLGSHSAISTDIDKHHRRIRLLRGELYVEAFHDPTRPLTIEAGHATVTVVGTRFSVSQRGDEVTVAVREGRVRLTSATGDSSLLQAGNWQQLTDRQLQPLHQDGGERQMAWTSGRLSFQDAPLAQVLGELRRYYPAPILLLDNNAARQRVSGNYQVDDPLAIAQALSKVTQTRITRLPGGVLLVR